MDIQLPEVSGLEVTRWLKDDDALCQIPIVAVTAFAMKGDEERIRSGGCEAYISKPISVTAFLETVRKFIGPPRALVPFRQICEPMTARVLVVDDILANVKLLEARLQAEYFEVVTANNGQQALDILARESVDVVLLDVMMPGMDGFEACRRIKGSHTTHHIPVVMVTALDQPSDKVLGLESGADDFLTKPVDDIALVTRVKNLARLKMLNDEMIMRASTGKDMGIPDDGSLARALVSAIGRAFCSSTIIRVRLRDSWKFCRAPTMRTPSSDTQAALMQARRRQFRSADRQPIAAELRRAEALLASALA